MQFLKLLSISPLEEDHLSLESIVRRSSWTLFKAKGLASALAILKKHPVSVIVCERDSTPRMWLDLLDNLSSLRQPPSLIVASRVADDRIWAEALNLGAWDVLAKPFEHREVVRSVQSAWQHWHNQAPKAMMAAS